MIIELTCRSCGQTFTPSLPDLRRGPDAYRFCPDCRRVEEPADAESEGGLNMDTPCTPRHPLQCGAKTRCGSPCRSRPMPNGRCRMHGGRSLAGPASKSFKHGKYSKYLPARLLERFREAESDRALLSLRDEIALVDARIDVVLARVDTGESSRAWKELGAAFARLGKARAGGDAAAADRAVGTIGGILGRGRADRDAWEDVRALIHDRRQLVVAEERRRAEMRQRIDVEEAVALMAVLVDAVRAAVAD